MPQPVALLLPTLPKLRLHVRAAVISPGVHQPAVINRSEQNISPALRPQLLSNPTGKHKLHEDLIVHLPDVLAAVASLLADSTCARRRATRVDMFCAGKSRVRFPLDPFCDLRAVNLY